jgi:outer membrane immunogenic protein
MKKIILATVLAGLGSASALAADMAPRPTYTKAPPMMTPVASWAGFYLGGNVGYGWGHNNTGFDFLPNPVGVPFGAVNTSIAAHSKGVIGGAQFGYNWQIGTTVFGFETDIQGSGISGSGTKAPTPIPPATVAPTALLTTDAKLSWFGTARARLGFAITPDLLLYGTGGAAYGQVKTSADTILPDTVDATLPANRFPAALSGTRVGWTAGAGTEWMFARNWSAKAEYLHVDLGSTSAVGFSILDPAHSSVRTRYTWKNQENIVRAGVNYHF